MVFRCSPAAASCCSPRAWTGTKPVHARQAATPVGSLPCAQAWVDDPVSHARTLSVDCVTDRPITIPEGWDFDGSGHLIRVIDPARGLFRGGVLETHGGTTTVRDVTIDGSGLTAGCSREAVVAGVFFLETGGSIEQVAITDVRRGVGDRCGYGMILSGPPVAVVRLVDATIRRPGDAGAVITSGRAEVSGVTIEDAGEDGIIVCCDGTTGTITDSRIVRPGNAGISVEDGGTATIRDSIIEQPGAIGVIAMAGATVEVSESTVFSGGLAGVVASDAGTGVTIAGATFDGQTRDGVYVQLGAAATVSDNTLTLAGGNGITLSATTGTGRVSGNRVLDAVVGIVIRDGAANAAVSDNLVRGGETGIRVAGPSTEARVTGNTIEATTVTGLAVENGARAEATENVITGPGTLSAAAAFGPAGIHYGSGASGVVRGNQVANYLSDMPGSLACGIAIDADAGEVDVAASVFPAPGNASNFCRGAPPEFWIPGRAQVVGTPVPGAD
ncbi:MAG: right-handed parallel beta-helix repeat-containing protein [Thermomicrobiales bacterium]